MFVRLHHFPPSCRWHVGRVAALRVITDRERARAIVTTTTTASLPLGVPTHVNPLVQAAVCVMVDVPNRFDGRFRTHLLALSGAQTRARWRAERQGKPSANTVGSVRRCRGHDGLRRKRGSRWGHRTQLHVRLAVWLFCPRAHVCSVALVLGERICDAPSRSARASVDPPPSSEDACRVVTAAEAGAVGRWTSPSWRACRRRTRPRSGA